MPRLHLTHVARIQVVSTPLVSTSRKHCLELVSATRSVFKDLWLEDKDKDKDKDFSRGQQHWVTVKNGLLADIYIYIYIYIYISNLKVISDISK